jgi:tetratricopeptide (TPR) repeat protein
MRSLLPGKLKNIFLFAFILFSSYSLSAQNIPADIVEQARTKAYSKDFTGADKLLTSYTENNDDINALRLHAQVLYWMQDFKRAEQVHRKLQRLYPDMNDIKLDYGRFLYEMGKIGSAEKSLKDYLHNDPDHAEANLMLTYINIWNGNMGKAKKRALHMRSIYPDNAEFNDVLKKITTQTSPLLSLSAATYSDDQPLKYSTLTASGQWYKSWLFSPTLQFQKRSYNSFEQDYTTSWLEAGNKIYFKSKTSIMFKGGVFYPAAAEEMFYTGSLGLKQQLSGILSLNLDYEVAPYQYTNSSILAPFNQAFYKGSLKLEKGNGLMGEAGFQQQVFPDDNTIKTGYFWMLFPLINEDGFKFNGGYSYNFSTSDESTFTIVETTSGGGRTGFPPLFNRPTTKTEGYYDLYFTPHHQQVNSLLGYMKIGSDRTNFQAKINVGFLASAYSPSGGNSTSVNFEKVNYTPVEFESSLNIGITKKFTLSGKYNYQSLFFYRVHMADIQLTYQFFK